MHRALLLVLGLLATPLLLVLTAGPAHACSCAVSSFAEQVADADAVFTGTVIERDDPSTGPYVSSVQPVYWTVAVDRVHRGDVGPRTTVVAALSEASCGLGFALGERYVVVGTSRPDGGVDTGLCTGTARHAALSAADLATLGPGSALPSPTSTADRVTDAAGPAPVEPSPIGSPPVGSVLAGAALVLILAIAALAAVVRRR